MFISTLLTSSLSQDPTISMLIIIHVAAAAVSSALQILYLWCYGKRRYSCSRHYFFVYILVKVHFIDCWWVSFRIEVPFDSLVIIYSFTMTVWYLTDTVESTLKLKSTICPFRVPQRGLQRGLSRSHFGLFVLHWGLITSKVSVSL